jgi:hypothetical protein
MMDIASIKTGFIKRAQECGFTHKQADDLFNNINPPQMQQAQMQHQQYMGQSPRRELSNTEQNLVDSRKSSLLPKIFQSLSDSPAVKMYNPMTDATLKGGLGAGIGGLAGGALAGMSGDASGDHTKAILGALLGGGIGGALGYGKRNAKNNDIEETMRHSPENSTLRHYYADPLVQKGQDREHEKMLAQLQSRGR